MKKYLLKKSKVALVVISFILLAITMLPENKMMTPKLSEKTAINKMNAVKNQNHEHSINNSPMVSEATKQAWEKEQEAWKKDIAYFNATKKAFEQKLQQLNLITREMNRYQGRSIPSNLERDYDYSKTEALIAHEKLVAMAQKILSKQGDRS